jgi:tryptophanyl-tRNA synthetase
VEITINHFNPIAKRYVDIRQSEEIMRVLQQGAEQASQVTEETLMKMKDAMGLM